MRIQKFGRKFQTSANANNYMRLFVELGCAGGSVKEVSYALHLDHKRP
jgi:hypothetical protein